MNITDLLHEFGLTKSKATVYLAALASGPATGQEIAAIAKLPRTTVHEVLSGLSLIGIVSYVTKGRTRIYTVEPPMKLKKILEEKERRLTSALPELMAMYNTKGVRPKVRFYEGVEGIKEVFEDTLTVQNKILCGILSMEDLFKIPGKEYMDDYVRRRVAAGIKLKVIRSEGKEVSETWPASTLESRDLHYAPKDLLFPMTLYIYDNKVGIIGTQKENFGMIIKSEDFYKTQINLFEVLWQVTKVAKRVD